MTSTIVLARILSPDDYGIIAMVLAIMGFAGLFRELGLSSAAIQNQNLTPELQSNLFWLNLLIGLALSLITYLSAPLVALFYAKPELTIVTQILSITFVVGSLSTQHSADLTKNLKFGKRAAATIGGSLATLICSIYLALNDYGYWALVWSNILGTATASILLIVFSRIPISLPSRESGVRSAIGFGINVTSADLVNYFHRNLDNILIGKVWGATSLGFYSRAYSLLLFPVHAIRTPVNSVAFPIFSKLQQPPQDLRGAFLKVVLCLGCLTMPITAFLFGNSGLIIELVLGSQWLKSAEIFSFLAIAAFTQPVTGMLGSLLLSLSKTRTFLKCSTINAISLSLCFLAGLPWGATGVAAAYAIGNYLILYPWLKQAFKDTPVSLGQFTSACLPPALSSLIALGAMLLANSERVFSNSIAIISINLLIFGTVFFIILSFHRTGREAIKEAVGIISNPLRLK